MSLETDLLLDRRRLRRRLFFWRVLGVLGVCAAIGLGVWRGTAGGAGWGSGGDHLARLEVSGVITDDRKLNDKVAALAGDPSVKALEVYVDSPGGSVAGGEGLHDAILRVAARKPVYVVMGGVAASAGYMISAPAERIFARAATLTGSIGVLLEAPDISGLLQKVGVADDILVSGPLKAQPSLVRPLSPEGRAVLQGLVMDLYDQFVAIVAAGRHMDPARVRELADGRAFTGRQALQLGLVDAIGGETEARAWLAKAHHIPATLPVRNLREPSLTQRLIGERLGGQFGGVIKAILSQGVMLDGAWALWQPFLRAPQ